MTTDVHTFSGAFALDALDEVEADEFRRHLEDCPACDEEVRELQGVAARMGAVEALNAPAHLRARVLAAVDRTPQLPPTVPLPTLDARRRERSQGRGWRPRLAGVAAAAVLVGAGAVGVAAVIEARDPALGTTATQVFEARDARTLTTRTNNGGELIVAVSPSRHQVAMDTRALPELEGDLVYQVWAVRGSSVSSAGVLEDPDEGLAMPALGDGTQVAITVEPAGGSRVPTTQPIVLVDPAVV